MRMFHYSVLIFYYNLLLFRQSFHQEPLQLYLLIIVLNLKLTIVLNLKSNIVPQASMYTVTVGNLVL